MTTRHALSERLETISDLSGVLGAMKNLALMEIRKMIRFAEHHKETAATLDRVASEFLCFYPLYSEDPGRRDLFLLFGSERGFCGDFNEQSIRALRQRCELGPDAQIIAIGSRLAARMETQIPVFTGLRGASTAEEVPVIMRELVEHLRKLPDSRLVAIYHDGTDNDVHVLEPLSAMRKGEKDILNAPMLNLEPEQFFKGFVDNYLLAVLHHILSASLLAENLFRLRHLENAQNRMEEKKGDLNLQVNRLRREEITQELEVIMLSVEARAP